MSQIVWLSQVAEKDKKAVGSKAANLGTLMAANVSVPNGFCITSSTYYQHILQSNQIDLQNLVAQRQFEDIYHHINCITFNPDFKNLLLNTYQELMLHQPSMVAVRSSSTAEDLKHYSFAGLYETVLNVDSEEALLNAVRFCWASYWSDEAIFYREQAGLSHTDHTMAILVQAMIQPTVAGVLFTQDPLSQTKSAMVVEFSEGNADALVSGDIRGDRVLLDRKSKQVLSTINTPGNFNPSFLSELAAIGLDIEDKQGDAQDIEWCLDPDNQLWIVQARSITSQHTDQTKQHNPIPPDWQLAYDDPYSTLGCNLAIQRHKQWVRIINDCYKTHFKSEIKEVENFLYYKSSWHKTSPPLRLWINFWKIINWLKANQIYDRYVNAELPDHTRKLTAIASQDIPELDDGELMVGFNSAIDLYLNLQYTSYPVVELVKQSITFLNILCRRWLNVTDNLQVSDFLSGLDNLTVKRDLKLHTLGQELQEILSTEEISTLDFVGLSELKNNASGQPLMNALQTFLTQYGYIWADRYPRDPAWEMNQAAVVASFAYASQAQTDDSLATGHDRRKQRRAEVVEKAKQQLASKGFTSFRWPIFNWFLRRAERFFPHKENRNHYVYQNMMVIRQYAQEIGRRMKTQQHIPSEQDVFFLTRDEIREVWSGKRTIEQLKQQIETRKRTYNRSKQSISEQTFANSPAMAASKQTDSNSIELLGEACSPGIATGPTRIVNSFGQLESVQPGDIVVCRNIRPAWSLVFAKASGVVVEVGSLLSHGATLAREYGVPTVMNVPSLTQSIHHGDKLTVNGDLGKITIERNMS